MFELAYQIDLIHRELSFGSVRKAFIIFCISNVNSSKPCIGNFDRAHGNNTSVETPLFKELTSTKYYVRGNVNKCRGALVKNQY